MTQWLSLQEAAALLEKAKPDNRPVRAKLYEMFQSGKVETYANDGVNVVKLGMKNFLDPCFGLNVEKGFIDLPSFPPNRVRAQISNSDLKAYLHEVPPDLMDKHGVFKILGRKYSPQGLLDLQNN